MAFAGKGLLALIWLLLVPAFAGALFFRKDETPTWIDCLLAGYLFLFSLSELLILPMMYFRLPLHVLVVSYGVLTGICALAGAVRLARSGRFSLQRPCAGRAADIGQSRQTVQPSRPGLIGLLRGSSPFLWAALAVIACQLAIVFLAAHFDADDALYVAAGTTATETDSIFYIDAYTGTPDRWLSNRYALSPFPIFLAVISRLCGGLHAAVTAHTIFPPIFLICVYSVMYRLAQKWFEGDRDAQGIFLFLTAMLSWFSAYSVYNTGSFQMLRLWQGKAVLAAFLLPLIYYLSVSIILERQTRYSWALLFMANLAGCLLTSMGIILTPLMTGLFLLLGLLRHRSVKQLFAGIACCLPSLVLGAVYLFLMM